MSVFMLQSTADRVVLADGWTRRLIAFGAGAVGALTLPPFGLWPFLIIALVPAIWLLDGAVATSRWRALSNGFSIGWWWGFGYHLAGLWWMGAAFLVEADRFAWAMPLGVIALPAGLALFTALAFALARLIWRAGPSRIGLFAILLTLSEVARGHILTGFPWNAPGMAFGTHLVMAQTAALVGLYGLTLIACIAGASFASLTDEGNARARWTMPLVTLLTLGAMAAYGFWRIPATATPLVAGVKLRIMQPNLQQDAKFHPENGAAIVAKYLALSDRATGPRTLGLQDTTHLIWPESAFPFLLGRTQAALSKIGTTLPANVTLITGAARAGEVLPGDGRPPVYNAIQVVARPGTIITSADKTHLVPFGEYLPPAFDSALRALGLKEFVAIPGGFSAGTRRTNMQIPGLPPAAPLICYEAIFPGTVVPEGERPGLLLNVTNDGWFGKTTGPHQHAAQARMRAIEEGLPLVRAANTGISMVTDGYGRILTQLALGEEGVLDSGLPRPLGRTVFALAGNGTALILLLVFALFVLFLDLRYRNILSGKPIRRKRR
jgi:apolipoprotein N-acyltransferase